MKKKMTFTQFLFITPLLILLAIFAVYPIITSAIYSLFDYRTNDQTVAGLYTKEEFNAPLFFEDGDYISWYLDDDFALFPEEDQTKVREIISGFDALVAPYKEEKEVIDIDKQTREELQTTLASLKTDLFDIYSKNKDIEFYHGLDNQTLLANDMEGCFIESNFSGFASYLKLLKDTRFYESLESTLIFTVISVFFEFCLGMGLALIMNKAIKGIGGVRTISLIPWAIPTAVSALMWSYMYDGSSGVIAKIFADLGFIDSPELLLLTAKGSMAAAILSDVWKTTPYMALLLLAGLQTIDTGLYESASIDGAGPVKTFFKITFPLLQPSILVALLFRTLDAFRVYDLIAVLTGGAQGTETLSIYAYKLMIGQSNYGYGSAVVLVMALCVGIIAFIFVKVLGAELLSDD